MKTKNIISIILSLLGISVLGQISSTVETPWGTTVNVWTPQNDMTLTQRKTLDSLRAIDYPDAEFHPTLPNGFPSDPSSSSMFNCHGYAWFMYWEEDEFDAPWNMLYTEAENYFDDPSFKECTKAEADIWWINNGSHSALATETTDVLLSKWDTGPLATHDKDDHPNGPNSSVTYFKKCSDTYDNWTFDVDDTMNECALKIKNSSISNNVDLEIEFEEVVLIVGPFSTGTSATLYIHPD